MMTNCSNDICSSKSLQWMILAETHIQLQVGQSPPFPTHHSPFTIHQPVNAAPRRLPVPQLRPLGHPAAFEGGQELAADALHVVPHQHARSAVFLQGHGALGVPAQGQAGGAEDAALLLQAAAIRQHDGRLHVQAQHLVVADGVQQDQVRAGHGLGPQAEGFEHLAGARVDGPDQGHAGRDLVGQEVQDGAEDLRPVHVGGAVHGQQGVAARQGRAGRAGFEQVVGQDGRRVEASCRVAVGFQGVDHDVANEADPLLGHALPAQVLAGQAVRGQEQVAQAVRDQAVDLLGHGHVSAAKSRLDMADLDAQLLGRNRAGQGGVDVPHHHDPVGLFLQQHLLEGDHGLPDLLGMGAGPDLQVDVRVRDAETVEEAFGHAHVVVLAGVDQDVLDGPGGACGVMGRDGLHEGRDFHEIGASAHDGDDFHRMSPLAHCAGNFKKMSEQ